ncbi:hypothetical protein BD311DRAFT_866794 [Dichomitus squalens]|uniref:Uncharacterized protein n=1 Tax=Dichomitus squalens TaxID=114155 RepID=A0A4Q9MIB6_9APHY|nr:hypothetical protein BD311DRAFT_866794 [Dichomitus squalens]TBU52216.1 hypothetical protein BD310DRAFT_889787 [Dichomitus squalens]
MPNLAPTQALPEPVSPGYEWVQSSEEAMEQEEQSPAEPSLSEVTLVEVTLLGDLVRILSETTAHQRALAEQERLANAHRAALIEVQREAAKHHAALAEQQRIANAVAIRSELRMYNSSASHWQALPLLDGEPLPADVEFPKNFWHLKRMEGGA